MKNKICIVALMSFVFSVQIFGMDLPLSFHQQLKAAAARNDTHAFHQLVLQETRDASLTLKRREFLDLMGYSQVEEVTSNDLETSYSIGKLIDPEISNQMKAYRGEVENASTITKIEEAIKNGTQEAQFYSCNVKVLRTKERNISPLDIAIRSQNPASVRLVLESSDGRAFDYLAKDTDKQLLALSVASIDMIKTIFDLKLLTLEQERQMLFTGIFSANEPLVLELINQKVDVNGLRGHTYHPNFLSLAMAQKCTETVILALINAGSEVNYANKPDLDTPLHCATRLNYPEATKILLEKMDAEHIKVENGVKKTALDIAIDNKNLKMVEILCASEKIDVNQVGTDGKTPLWKAADDIENEAIVTVLLANERTNVNKPCEAPGFAGLTVLHRIAGYGVSYPIFLLLLNKDGIDVNATKSNGKTILDTAKGSLACYVASDKEKMRQIIAALEAKGAVESEKPKPIEPSLISKVTSIFSAHPDAIQAMPWYQRPNTWIGLSVVVIVAALVVCAQKYGTGFDFTALINNLIPSRA